MIEKGYITTAIACWQAEAMPKRLFTVLKSYAGESTSDFIYRVNAATTFLGLRNATNVTVAMLDVSRPYSYSQHQATITYDAPEPISVPQ